MTMNFTLKHANFGAFLLAIALGISHGAILLAQDEPKADDATQSAAAAAVEKRSLLDVTLNAIDGRALDLSVYQGKVIVVVNTASECGFTSQYKQLQKIHKQYHEQGLVVLGFPCNQFGGQEPGENEEIAKSCKDKYGVTFELFAKSDVNGDQRNELYKSLCKHELKPKSKGDVSWNFEKFIIGRAGHPVGRFAARVSPTDDEFITLLKQELAKEAPEGTAAVAEEK